MKPILLATDGSPAAEGATETAIELAKLLGTELVVTTVWSIPALTVGFAPTPLPADIGMPAEQEARRIAAEAARRAEFDYYQKGQLIGAERFIPTPDAVIRAMLQAAVGDPPKPQEPKPSGTGARIVIAHKPSRKRTAP